jgi:hypothetical protein
MQKNARTCLSFWQKDAGKVPGNQSPLAIHNGGWGGDVAQSLGWKLLLGTRVRFTICDYVPRNGNFIQISTQNIERGATNWLTWVFIRPCQNVGHVRLLRIERLMDWVIRGPNRATMNDRLFGSAFFSAFIVKLKGCRIKAMQLTMATF